MRDPAARARGRSCWRAFSTQYYEAAPREALNGLADRSASITSFKMDELLEALGDVIPRDHSSQVTLSAMFAAHVSTLAGPIDVLDLGCGDGRAIDFFMTLTPVIRYVGVDIANSPEVAQRIRSDATFYDFDGTNLPFADGSFDVIYCNQVFEHVRHPEKLAADIRRTLKPGGLFLAGLSFLEPYHSYSIFNLTPYGVLTIFRDANLRVLWIRPSIDGVTLIVRTIMKKRRFFDRWWQSESPLNRLLGLKGRLERRSVQQINAMKLAVTGQIIFAAQRDPGG